jgi:hypothetical protein
VLANMRRGHDFLGPERLLYATEAPFIAATISDAERAVEEETRGRRSSRTTPSGCSDSALPAAFDQLGVTPSPSRVSAYA